KLRPLAGRYNMQFKRGAVTAEGHVKYAPWVKEIRLLELLVDHMHVDYVHSARTAKKEKREGNHVAKKAKEIHRRADMLVKVGHAKVLNSEVGFVNQAASPDYRVFVDELNVEVEDFSNRLEEGSAVVKVTGKFMGTGRTLVKGKFRPEKPDPDFDLDVQIVKTRLPSMNNVFRAYSDVDLKAGTFAFFSEMKVKDGHVDGYVKPFFKDVEVYDPEQDQNKAVMQKMFEAVVDGVMGILENVPTKGVATETSLEGPVENPRADTWEVVVNLVQNAFFKAILPGLERESKRT
ncbi:MAG TPA: DUF748 domain-containing protein, partial [Nitrospiraceae bacterium]